MGILTYKDYHGHFEYIDDADLFHGRVINLTDVITFQGRSIDELKQSLADSVEDYLEFCEQEGKDPEKPYSGRFNVRIEPNVHGRLVLAAAKRDISLNSLVAEVLLNYVEAPLRRDGLARWSEIAEDKVSA
ncbi:MAG: type II toxin-antitoxin system HicB family antitoxin [Deltaproteobacteria bacterium]|jgi:predicted HicB family RNase H-like nuclease|nr:type II toxin-antitoxin system HicB family antitoxin [Deltaproteobacteria bacterium]